MWYLLIPFLLCADSVTIHTKLLHRDHLNTLPFHNQKNFEEVDRGFIAPLVKREERGPEFTPGSDPSVHPSLHRQQYLLSRAGLFKVTEGIYQVRGLSPSHTTIIESRAGIIVIDPMSRAALDLYYQNRPKREVQAVIYTRDRAEEEVVDGDVAIYASSASLQREEQALVHAVRAQRALLLQEEEEPLLSTYPSPTHPILFDQEMAIDGVLFTFFPSADGLAFYLPQFKALCLQKSHSMPTFYSLKGAKIWDAKEVIGQFTQAITLSQRGVNVLFSQYHWPVWEAVSDFLERQRDLCKYIHDQTIRLARQGYSAQKVAENLKMPATFKEWDSRGYCADLSHNARSVYQYYLGWFDGDPLSLQPLPSLEASRRYVEYMGGAASIVKRAQSDFTRGDYRWCAQVLQHVTTAHPKHQVAKELLAKCYVQLGFQSENGEWRAIYLTKAKELREDLPQASIYRPPSFESMSSKALFDYLATCLDGYRADTPLRLHLYFTDTKESYFLEIKNNVLHASPYRREQPSSATLSLDRSDFVALLAEKITVSQLLRARKIDVAGKRHVALRFAALIDKFSPTFFYFER